MIQNPNILVRNFINKEGVISDGVVSAPTAYTYTGNFQYIDIDYIPSAQGGNIAIRDIGDNYESIYPKLITIMDRESGRIYNTAVVDCAQTNRILRLRVDARNAKGVRITLASGINGKVCVTKVNANGIKSLTGVLFANLRNTDATSTGKQIYNLYKNTPHKKYLVLRVTTTEASSYNITLKNLEDDSGTSANFIKVQDKHTLYSYIRLDFAGEKYFYADVSNQNICTVIIGSNATAKISNLDYFFTDDLAFAEYAVGRNADSKNVDIITNDGLVQSTVIDLSKLTKRWYVLYLDIVSGTMNYNGSAHLQNFYLTTALKMLRYDMYSTSNSNYYFFIGGLRSGYYFLDLSTAPNPNATISIGAQNYGASNVPGLNLQITHIGEFDDISQFQSINEAMPFGDGLFECKRMAPLGVDIHYALDEYWVNYQANVVTLCKAGQIYKINILDAFNWRTYSDTDRRCFIIHPCLLGNVDSLHTNLLINVYDDNDGGKTMYKVCNIDDPRSMYDSGNWSNVKFWEKRGSARKIPTKNASLVDSKHRYDTTLPDYFYQFDEVSADGYHIQWQDTVDVFSIQHFMCHGKSLTLWGRYNTTGERIAAWATSDGGRNFVAFYDFVNYYENDYDINTSAFADYAGGLTLSQITCINPTAENKEPANKYSITELSGWTLNKGAKTTITFNAAHGFSSNVLIALTGNSTTEWNQLKTSSLDANSIGDNIYLAIPTDATTLELHPYMGSYDTQLSCRHIHSINETKTGYIIGCGEEYPNGWVLFVEDYSPSTGQNHDAMTRTFEVIRLTSTQNSIQRPCGLIMKEDGADPLIIFASDSANVGNVGGTGNNFRWTIPGRTNLPKSNTLGIWKGRLSDIDDITKFECVCDIPHDLCIWTFRYNGIILVYCQYGGMAVSLDDGETFTFYPYYFAYRRLTGVYQGKIILNYGYEFIVK